MSRLTAPRRSDFYQGENPTFSVTRYKSDLANHIPGAGELGSATDRGFDPAITAIPYTVAGTAGICTTPTADWWSAQVSGMAFMVEIENNAAADLTVDLEFYRGVYGSTGAIEKWELIEERLGVVDGEPAIIVGETAGSSVFVRVAGITNHDAAAQLYISSRLASSAEIASCGADSEVGSNIVGVKGWYATGRNWVGLLVDASGQIVTSSGAAIVAALATIIARLTSLVSATDDHDAAPTDDAGSKILIEAMDDPTTALAAVDDGDLVRPRGTRQGGVMVAGLNGDTAQTINLPIDIFGYDVSNNAIPVCGRATDIIQLAVAAGQSAPAWNSLNGARAVAGYDVTTNLTRVLPVEASGVVSSATGVVVGGVCDTTIPAAVDDTDFIPLWMGPQGTVGIHGYDVTNNVPRALPVESSSAVASGVAVPVLGRVDTTTPTAGADNTVKYFWLNPYGAQAVFQTQGSDYTTSSVTTRETPASGGVPGTTAISNAATTPLNAGTSAACKRVTVCNNGTGWMRVGVGVQTATTGIVLQPGDTRTMDVDDIAKVQAWAQNLNDPCGWDYETV